MSSGRAGVTPQNVTTRSTPCSRSSPRAASVPRKARPDAAFRKVSPGRRFMKMCLWTLQFLGAASDSANHLRRLSRGRADARQSPLGSSIISADRVAEKAGIAKDISPIT